jgi:hypothetical protein
LNFELILAAAQAALGQTAAAGGAGLTKGQVTAGGRMCGRDAEQLFELGAAAIGAPRLLAAADQQLKLGGASLAGVFVKGHGRILDLRFWILD